MKTHPGMTVPEFIAKWRKVELTERSAAQQHFLDLCSLVGHKTPAAADPTGEDFTFEKGAKTKGGNGWADVWKRGFFAWEYKGKHGNLEKAYDQLLRYRESLENPPLLVVSDMGRMVVRTNFTNTPTVKREIALEELTSDAKLADLRAVFFDPDRLRPLKTTQHITETAAKDITDIAHSLRSRGFEPQKVARFLDRIVFCLFAQDVGYLPQGLFKQLIENAYQEPKLFAERLISLFAVMATGGGFGVHTIQYFNGDLFADAEVLLLSADDLLKLRMVANQNWSAIDPSIFGTLFERALDPDKRSQLGAHYTSRADIEMLVEPVVFQPLRREWVAVRQNVEGLLHTKDGKGASVAKAQKALLSFITRLQQVTVLDPACGSGNFLYVVLHKLKNLEKEIILYAMDCGFPAFLPQVGPWQLHGIEKNAYAHELAQMTVWIGWLQWIKANGLGEASEPILQKLDTFECRDAVLVEDANGSHSEPSWPKVEFIVGNPPFLDTKKLRATLGDVYVNKLFALYGKRIPNFSDLCCYWFEKAREQVEHCNCRRVGLLATQGIRGGLNREVLRRVMEGGKIFFAVSDRDWILDGANVHVSMIGFDNGSEPTRTLDGHAVDHINPDLTACADITLAKPLSASQGIAYYADVKAGNFDLSLEEATPLLSLPNPNARPNSDVLTPWANGRDILQRPRDFWNIDFPSDMDETQACRYEAPYERVRKLVRKYRKAVKRKSYRDYWWVHAEPCDAMRQAIKPLTRYLATPATAKHRLFVWLTAPTLPDHALVVFAREDDFFFGVMQSRVHLLWADRKGTQLRDAISGRRYTPTTCMETFPLPDATDEQIQAISSAAAELDGLRRNWLNPPTWVRQETLSFSASVDGPWASCVAHPNKEGIGTASYTRLVPNSATDALSLRKRTLTNLYNKQPKWLAAAHQVLDERVFAAYGWSPQMSDDEVLSHLLDLNLSGHTVGGAKP